MTEWAVRALCAAALAWAGVAWSAGAAELKRWTAASTPPGFALKDASGTVHDLRQYRGRVVLINFWATWCEPCRDEMPSLQKLRAKFAGQPFSLLTVDIGESESKVADFLGRLNVDVPVLFDKDLVVARQWKVRLLPASFVLDAKGAIRYSLLGEANWDAPEFTAAIAGLLAAPR